MKSFRRSNRFAEGAEFQRRALAIRPDYQPAQFQLAQDLLRLGKDEEGWELAAGVQERDGYHVVAFNLDEIEGSPRSISRAHARRFGCQDGFSRGGHLWPIRAGLAGRSPAIRCVPSTALVLNGPVLVEIFPYQEDFAIRTFGLPGGDGYLGVCFGSLITVNSPASQGSNPSNWQSVLWHEFCHVVTLQKTRNRMPRWLSEGISVYEERQRHPAWGERMTPTYREMILGNQLTPVSPIERCVSPTCVTVALAVCLLRVVVGC